MTDISLRGLKKYLIIALLAAVISWVVLPQDRITYKIINALFTAGAVLLCTGGLGFASYLGGFDLFSYTHKKLSKYSHKNIDDPSVKDVGSYYEYIEAKRKSTDFILPLIMGAVFIIFSVLFSALC